ncbi:uncharacterized protein LOC103962543 isoform X2 [Pyrus x bretschneideri]|uniref:uncharacterized protein LOC103962543 isoform X2 n=1 Tax=Pyrus x bretschneideri TaxID=225117 RepID=UPI00202E9214|nr:uncharacterized protein LOC103962543 isoform X2 [Pyrus x bretschneideri]
MFLGIAVYLRLWTIDYSISSDESELVRQQFDLANREAMDESAEWRLKYNEEAEKATKCMNQLKQITGSFGEGDGNAATVNQKLLNLQKENKSHRIFHFVQFICSRSQQTIRTPVGKFLASVVT